MEINTSQLCDTYADLVDVIDPIFSNYGGIHSFGGKVVTIKCFEGTGLIEKIVTTDGKSKVLVIDGGGSTRRALIDINIAETAASFTVLFYGCSSLTRMKAPIETIKIAVSTTFRAIETAN